MGFGFRGRSPWLLVLTFLALQALAAPAVHAQLFLCRPVPSCCPPSPCLPPMTIQPSTPAPGQGQPQTPGQQPPAPAEPSFGAEPEIAPQ